jgi:hypothetical protein
MLTDVMISTCHILFSIYYHCRGHLEVTDANADLKISPIELMDEGEYRSFEKQEIK